MTRLSLLPNLTAVQMTNAILRSMAEYPTGRKALAAQTVAEAWRRELPIRTVGLLKREGDNRALALRIIREAQRSCLAIVARWAPNQSEAFYLGLIQGIIADNRPDRTTVEREVITAYADAKAAARAQQIGGTSG